MSEISAFVGHSFADEDKETIAVFLDFFNKVEDMNIGFSWDHAQPAEPKELSQKVLQKMENKNLFIGICTPRERVIDPAMLKGSVLRKKFLMAKPEAFSWKISDWILQEIGLAFGREMPIILIAEEGIRSLGGIQGDLEYIPFRRSEPEKTFPKILEMLKTVMPSKVKTTSKDIVETVEEKNETQGVPEPRDDRWKPEKEWDPSDYEFALLHAIAGEDKEEEDKIYNKYLQTDFGRKESQQIEWQAKRLFFKHWFRKDDKLEELKALVRKYPTHSSAIYCLARVFTIYEQFDKASGYFQKAAELSSNDTEKIRMLCDAAVSLAKHGDKPGAFNTLDQAKDYISQIEVEGSRLLKAMSDVCKTFDEDDNFVAINEALLDQKPDDHERRFALALKYSELNENELAYYHYNILKDENPNEAVWNNLGVAASQLGLSYKSVKSYKESERLGGTLAMSNLAHKLMDAGFVPEASKVCERALKIENYDKQIGTAITRIKNIKDNQKELAREKLHSTKPVRSFFVRYAIASTRKMPIGVDGTWRGPNCDLNISIKEDRLEARGSYEQEIPNLFTAILEKTAQKKPSKKTINLIYYGEIFGMAVKFEKHIKDKFNIFSNSDDTSIKGLMIISEDLTTIEVYEKGKDVIYKINKLQ